MKYRTRKLIKPEDLNSRGTLFGGQLLKWIDEEAAIFAMCQLSRPDDTQTPNIVTKAISEIDFKSSAYVGDIIEIGCGLVGFGTTSVTLECEVRNKHSQEIIVKIDKIVFVQLDKRGIPTPHGFIK
jgi:acyl-CoA thioesterase YciA